LFSIIFLVQKKPIEVAKGGDPYLGQIPSTVPSTAKAVAQTVPKYGSSTDITVPKPYKAVHSRTIRQYDDNAGILLLVYLCFDQGNKQSKRGRGGCGGYSISGFLGGCGLSKWPYRFKKEEEKSRHRTRDLLRFVPRLGPLVQTNKISVHNLLIFKVFFVEICLR